MKKLLLGIALILFGILLMLAETHHSTPIDLDVFGLISGVIGLAFSIIGSFEKKQ